MFPSQRRDVEGCKVNWWTNLLMVSNLVRQNDQVLHSNISDTSMDKLCERDSRYAIEWFDILGVRSIIRHNVEAI